MKKRFSFIVLISFILLNSGCKKNPTEPEKLPTQPTPPSLELSVDGVSCTEAWIKVKKLNDTTFLPISLKLNDKEFFHGFLAATDTVLFIDNLSPNTTYTVKGIILDTLQTSKELKVTTLPTTSHNFTWKTFEFGEHSTSTLYDVAVIDENNIWAVGEIYMNDSLGNLDSHRYNAVHWDGNRWEIKRIPYDYLGTNYYHPIHSVFAFGANDVWFCGNGVIHWNGSNYLPVSITTEVWGPYQMNKMWGTNSNDLYFVGNNGSIAHYDGKNWQKIESGTDLDFYDIWGNYDITTNKSEILTVARSSYDAKKQEFLRIRSNNTIETFPLPEDSISIVASVWFSSTIWKKYFCGDGLLTYNSATGKWKREDPWPYSYSIRVRGTAENDVYSVGLYGFVTHYNGVDWKILTNFPGNAVLGSIVLKNNLVVITGFVGSKAHLAVGRHN